MVAAATFASALAVVTITPGVAASQQRADRSSSGITADTSGGKIQRESKPVKLDPPPYLSGPLSTDSPSAGGYAEAGIYDSDGRYVFLHGVNAVYKRAPFVLSVAPGKPWNFDSADAKQIASLGFNVVRLGILWQGVEPGTLGPNNPKVCSPGQPGDPGQWNQAVANSYIQRVAQTVDLLGQYHVYSLLDMHQDVYNQVFKGEGAPAWAVCTNGHPLTKLPGRWSNNYASKPLGAAFRNFWTNDVVGNLQGEYDRSWAAVAAAFATNPWIAGYDPINEPFTTSVSPIPSQAIDDELECFYTGSAHPGQFLGKPLTCAPGVPAQGVIPSIRAGDSNRIIWVEPTIYEVHDQPNFVGAMPFGNLALNFHAYCGGRNPITGNPYDESKCISEVEERFLHRTVQTLANPSPYQPDGLPLFLSEFGATHSTQLVGEAASFANLLNIGWAYWQWKYYNDPTGSAHEPLASPSGHLFPQAAALAQAYPEAIAGIPLTYLAGPSGAILLTYLADPRVTAPTLIYVPVRYHFPHGYCAHVSNATLESQPNSSMLAIRNSHAALRVSVSVEPGKCK